MAEKDKKVTFELKDLTYMELVDIYQEVSDFLYFLSEAKVALKEHKDRISNIADDVTDDESLDLEKSETDEAGNESLETSEEQTASKEPAPEDDDDDEDDVSLPKMKGA